MQNVTWTKTFRLGELFCGPGGLACGARMASEGRKDYIIDHAWATDYDSDTCRTYTKNICPDRPETVLCEDVHTLDLTKLGGIDAFAYGFPCNDFSLVGEKKGFDGEFGPLYTYGIQVLNMYRPKWFLAENVSGLRSSDGGRAFEKILSDMENAGYEITPNMYCFEKYGIPQTRHRIIIVGIRDDIAARGVQFRVPSPEPYKNVDISARTALSGIPAWAENNEVRRQSETVQKRLHLIQPGENVWQAEERMGKDFPDELKIHTSTRISQIYRKLDPEKPGYTVTASGGGGTFGYHWTDRELTNRERARIQTFPDDYTFVGKYSSVRRQIGMAVPPKGAAIIFKAILDSFAGIPYPYIDASY